MRVQRWQDRRAEYLREKGAREWVVTGRDGRVILRAIVYEREGDDEHTRHGHGKLEAAQGQASDAPA
jgi:hypothetical protein